jgi:hypothetical protein
MFQKVMRRFAAALATAVITVGAGSLYLSAEAEACFGGQCSLCCGVDGNFCKDSLHGRNGCITSLPKGSFCDLVGNICWTLTI